MCLSRIRDRKVAIFGLGDVGKWNVSFLTTLGCNLQALVQLSDNMSSSFPKEPINIHNQVIQFELEFILKWAQYF